MIFWLTYSYFFSAWVDENRKIIDVKLKTFGCGSNEDTIVLQVSQ